MTKHWNAVSMIHGHHLSIGIYGSMIRRISQREKYKSAKYASKRITIYIWRKVALRLVGEDGSKEP